jgi:hypothetical protein
MATKNKGTKSNKVLGAKYLYMGDKGPEWGTYQDSIKNPVEAIVWPVRGRLYIQVK